MIEPMAYRERPAGVAGVVVWSTAGPSRLTTILPDGCMDLVWTGSELVVAGPDTAARHLATTPGPATGLRFARGLGPRLLGLPADAVRDLSPSLADVWGARRADALAARVADDPGAALLAWLAAQDADPDPFGARVFAGLGDGLAVADVADRLGCSARTLHRRSRPVFGYGPQHLARILRLQRALDGARRGRPWAEVAATVGYVDQPHLAREVRALTGMTPTALLADRAGTDQPDDGANRSTW